jgi:hypothetical protein
MTTTQTHLRPAPVSARQINWHPTGHGFGEISSTNGFGRVYPDACDVGLTVISSKTGREIVFVVERTDRDDEGEVIGWTLRSLCGYYTLRLHND